jgi:DNA-binding transcriptional ArsR family regulator
MPVPPNDPIAGVLALDRRVHEPARLAILTVLGQVEQADFSFLELATGLTKGNLSSHLSKLEEGGLVQVEKRFQGKRPQTLLAITATGAEALLEYRRQLERFIAAAPAPNQGRSEE